MPPRAAAKQEPALSVSQRALLEKLEQKAAARHDPSRETPRGGLVQAFDEARARTEPHASAAPVEPEKPELSQAFDRAAQGRDEDDAARRARELLEEFQRRAGGRSRDSRNRGRGRSRER